ncbi:MAG: hypothetical protein JNG84_07775 [Archangium sp.]|nr:hypothetical protein [Archangium sp.]
MASTLELLRRLAAEQVDFVLVGGMAAVAHGSTTVTEDADVCIRFDLATLERVLRAVGPLSPRERMNPNRPALGSDAGRFVGYRNLDLTTDEGVLDLLGDVIGVGDFSSVSAASIDMNLGDFTCRVLGLDALIRCKTALGRPKDRQVVSELELVQRHLAKRSP